jgi:hypothetical protein
MTGFSARSSAVASGTTLALGIILLIFIFIFIPTSHPSFLHGRVRREVGWG